MIIGAIKGFENDGFEKYAKTFEFIRDSVILVVMLLNQKQAELRMPQKRMSTAVRKTKKASITTPIVIDANKLTYSAQAAFGSGPKKCPHDRRGHPIKRRNGVPLDPADWKWRPPSKIHGGRQHPPQYNIQ
jgi:hypothetical protein